MNHRALGIGIVLAVAAAVAVLGGCAGEDAGFAPPLASDEIIGHWTVSQQSTAVTGARSATALRGDVSFVFTSSALAAWSGTVSGTSGAALSPAFGSWVRTGNSYALTNDAGQKGSFAWSGTELYATTRVGGKTVYLWWTRH